MSKVKIIFGLLVVCSIFVGCSAGKMSESVKGCRDPEKIIENTFRNNLSADGFFIQKGKLIVDDGKEKVAFLLSVKYGRDGRYLVSIRSISGIEAMRVYLDFDTLMINDRINREVVYGKASDFERITGINTGLLKICFGDLPGENIFEINESEKNRNTIGIKGFFSGIMYNSNIDCNLKRPVSTEILVGEGVEFIKIEYKKYDGELYKIPREIVVYDSGRQIKLNLRMRKYIIPWHGDIEFIPGAGYRKRKLSE